MFGKAKRFDIGAIKDGQNSESTAGKSKSKLPVSVPRPGRAVSACSVTSDNKSETNSTRSVKSAFVTPKPAKQCIASHGHSSCKKPLTPCVTPKFVKKPTSARICTKTDIVSAQEVEIRNKDYTIAEYGKQIEDLKNEIAVLQDKIKVNSQTQKQECLDEIEHLNREIAKVTIEDENEMKAILSSVDYEEIIIGLQRELNILHSNEAKLEEELLEKQVELSSMENLIAIRDSLCKDLQNKLTEKEGAFEEIKQRSEMVKGHHALALEANESIRREYKIELECLKTKMDEEKLAILTRSKCDQETIKARYVEEMENLRNSLELEKKEEVAEIKMQLKQKEEEMKAKLEQIEERAHEKLRLCEIQYEQRNRSIQEHWQQQQDQIKLLELELGQLKYSLSMSNEQKMNLQSEMVKLRNEREDSQQEKLNLLNKIDDLEELSKKKSIEYENEKNKLTAEVERVLKEKHMYETSLTVTRDIVQVLSTRLRDTDNEMDSLENKIQELTESKQVLENELASYKSSFNNSIAECYGYKDALVNILKSKAALAKEHNRMMEHNATLIDCLETVEKEAFREFGNIKDEMVQDVETFKNESSVQIKNLKEEVEKKRTLALLATEHAGQAQAAAEQSRLLLHQASLELDRMEAENLMLKQQMRDQQSLAVEVSLLRQENEELTMTVAKQSSVIDIIKKDSEQIQNNPKSPSVQRKTHKVGKENSHILISPLRERNH